MEAHRTFARNHDVEQAQGVFLDMLDRATNGVKTAMAGTPYAKGYDLDQPCRRRDATVSSPNVAASPPTMNTDP